MKNLILSKAVISDHNSDSIANFDEIPLLVPRGK